jgi:NADPH:quinone reductase-like Zn-dependent oxidoreductase
VGTFAVQIAKSFGTEVTAVCSTRNVDIAGSIGADHVIDYSQEDFSRNGQRYDLILAANGYRSLSDYKRALAPEGSYIASGGTLPQIFESMLLGPWYSIRGRKKLGTMGESKPNRADMTVLAELLAAGEVVPVIDRSYPLSEVPTAVAYVEQGHAQGKVVITV